MRLSVVIPVYNDAPFLEVCLQALGRQTRLADEVIVVDNNSTDQSNKIARAHGATIVREQRQGIWAAAACGYSTAKGDIIARLDADSIPPDSWLEQIAATFEADGQVTAVTGPGNFYGVRPSIALVSQLTYIRAYFILIGLALGKPPLFGSNFAMRHEAWHYASTRIHCDERYFDDIDLSYHLPPSAVVRYDRLNLVQVSGRPLLHPVGMLRRYRKGIRTIWLHWPDQAPWRRVRMRLSKVRGL